MQDVGERGGMGGQVWARIRDSNKTKERLDSGDSVTRVSRVSLLDKGD